MRRRRTSWMDVVWWNVSPPRRVVLASAAAVLLGALLLWAPFTQVSAERVAFPVALMTATSALCTTGLAVDNITNTWNVFGLLVIGILVQIGGVGLLTVSFWFALLSRRADSVRLRLGVVQQLGVLDLTDGVTLTRRVLALSVGAELIGALLMLPSFAGESGWARGALYAAMHAVMAFNNAGFAMYDDALARFRTDTFVNVTLMTLVILGGLGFLVIENIRGFLRDRRVHLTTYTKMCLTATLVLLLGSAAFVTTLEWSGALRDLSPTERVMAGTFAAVSARSAGFGTLDLATFAPVTLTVLMLLMFVGTNPNSTGGGVKTTTVFVLLAFAVAVVRGRAEANVFRRRLSMGTLLRAVTVLTLSLVTVGFGTLALLLTNPSLSPARLAFEAVSAFGTAGLSVNTTGRLNDVGLFIVTVLMFLGRVGLLTLLVALGRRADAWVRYPEERSILVG